MSGDAYSQSSLHGGPVARKIFKQHTSLSENMLMALA